MRVFYVHEESLPSKSRLGRHVYGVGCGLADWGCEVCLVLMRGSGTVEEMHAFYSEKKPNQPLQRLKVWPVFSLAPLMRHFGVDSSWPMLPLTRSVIDCIQPHVLLCSSWEAASFFLQRKDAEMRYVQELFTLPFYSQENEAYQTIRLQDQKKIIQLKQVLHAVDLVIVPTQEILQQLQKPPYFIRETKIKVLPFASSEHCLPRRIDLDDSFIKLFYVGDLDESNGLEDLAYAMEGMVDFELHLVTQDIERIQETRDLLEPILGPSHLFFHNPLHPEERRELLSQASAFVAPFRRNSPALYEGHPSLPDYMAWCRPILAPHFPVIRHLLPKGPWEGLLYEPGSIEALQAKLQLLQNTTYRFMISDSLYECPLEQCSQRSRTHHLKRLLQICRSS
ncbi:glycosyltransferase family 4 protein [Candidatus Similichlamydia laticola]|uniref:Glycosyltransferase subfamily 4-like N-terminal domain-containing protein n=1 Tax=Candidatus Similichlamydia laticola TaxID=2170265 RepID=A0A369KJA5_9BACT|nr:glycosyltransferase family 4 protein [Candidatus Similichlamydia laticola]RDB31834.1 hypothetical protein HAT2_00056 [Candidatus Similichlamydia laticola]